MISRAGNPVAPASSEAARVSSDLMPAEGAGGLSASTTSGGLEITDKRIIPFWAIITGRESGTNQYSFTQVDDGDPDNSFGATLSADFAASGGTTPVNGCAYEINGRTDVPAASTTRVRVYPAGDLSFYVFNYGPAFTGSGIFGQDFSTPGGIMVWADDTGQWAAEASGMVWKQSQNWRFVGFPSLMPNYHFIMQTPETQIPPLGDNLGRSYDHYISWDIWNYQRGSGLIFTSVTATSVRELAFTHAGRTGNIVQFSTFLGAGGVVVAHLESYDMNDFGTSGKICSHPDTGGGTADLIREHSAVRNWMKHYTSTGVAGITATKTVKDGTGVNQTVTIVEGIITAWT